MVDFRLIIVVSVGLSSGLTGLAYFLLKEYLIKKITSSVEHNYHIKLEAFKYKLNHQYDVKLQETKMELDKKISEHQVQYSKLHIDRSESLKQIYLQLLVLEEKLLHLTSIGQGPEWVNDVTREAETETQLNRFRDLTNKNRIYFEVTLCNVLDGISNESTHIISEMRAARSGGRREDQTGRYDNSENSPFKRWLKLGERVTDKIQGARLGIEREFRKILGVN